MNWQLSRLPWLIAERRSTAVFGIAVIAMLWAGIGVKHAEDVLGDRRACERDAQNLAMVAEEDVLRSIGEIDESLLYMRRSIETSKDRTDYSTIVNTTDMLSEIIVQVAIIDAEGIMRASNAGPQSAAPVDLSDSEDYRAHLGKTEDNLHIGKPMIDRASGQLSIHLTRRFVNPDGSFAGVVVGSLNPAHLTRFYDRFDFSASPSISLIRTDGVVQSSGGRLAYEVGRDLSGTQRFALMRRGANVVFESTDGPDRRPRLEALREVRGLPLWVSASLDIGQALESSSAALKVNFLAGLVLTTIILAGLERLLRSEEGARQKANQLRLTLEHMSQGIMLVTRELDIPIINGRCGQLLGLPPEWINNPPRFDRLMEHQIEQARPHQTQVAGIAESNSSESADAAPATGPPVAVCERTMSNGDIIEVRSTELPDGSLVQTFTDITKRCEAEAHVARLASQDPLTGLANRRVFGATLDEISRQFGSSQTGGRNERSVAAPRASPRDGDAPDDVIDPSEAGASAHAIAAVESAAPSGFGVLFLDLDRFKVVNDTLGHRIGDLLLQEVARRLQGPLRANDLLARLGGDEFAIVVPPPAGREDLAKIAQALIGAVAAPYEILGHQICTGLSIGIAIGPDDGDNAEDLLMAADLAVYAVKASSRGNFAFYHSAMNKELNDRRQIEIDLREAIEHNQLEMYYQPIINVGRNCISGFEALARWRHPVKGMVPPALFIPVAEDCGLIVRLGEWALQEACREAVKWPGNFRVAVNLSPMQVALPNLAATVESILAETGLAPERLELEITERIFLSDHEHTLATLLRIKALGVRIALDDFGTGYSSLSYLRSFPFDKIKVDRAFVSDVTQRNDYVVIVQAIISIAGALGMMTTAEGVETADQRQFLAALGCDEMQGYLFSAPVPVEQIPELVMKWSAASLAA
jgi:diguanylate cyclase (GGDEF)-like protein